MELEGMSSRALLFASTSSSMVRWIKCTTAVFKILNMNRTGSGTSWGVPRSQKVQEELRLVEVDLGDSIIEDPELEVIKTSGVKKIEEEDEKLKELQNEVEKQMKKRTTPGNAGSVITSLEKMEADASSIYVGNVDYGATAEELQAHFHGCVSVDRVTTVCGQFSGLAKGFAYIEFLDKESVRTSLALDDSLFRGRQIKMIPITTTHRGFPCIQYHAQATNYISLSRLYSGFNSRPWDQVYRGQARVTSWHSPY
ncbi:LOW QUALITY PROTEIN: polyadenylate-binding protein 2-like [Arvicola amphibius]|uniref:LOW QUALITY PROTEIN: polyadenylate-binding protein 2-like n=1 Tax=Arvicola amphibius TaxID=1047088 RepID=UPI001C07F5C5|nr:LOW QUALITY PROTEIN: polyadenylate-binding protein 2-like [Arvicola amphibius]